MRAFPLSFLFAVLTSTVNFQFDVFAKVRCTLEEYYLYNPEQVDLTIWQRRDQELEAVESAEGWVSPRLGVRFQLSETALQIFGPNGAPFVSFVELAQLREQAELRAEQEQQRAEQERQRAEQAETLLEQERSRSEALEARLREMGIDPNIL